MPLDINKLDLYGILGVQEDASEKEILKSYRKKALKCHPDKNPDDPRAAEEFHKLSKALEILTDAAARTAYDKTLKAKKVAEQRHRELDSKRKKFKEDLEARENNAQQQKEDDLRAQRNLEAEINRLRKEGSKLLEQEKELLRQSLADDGGQSDEEDKLVSPKLKMKWKAQKGDDDNGGYSYDSLQQMLSKYGEVTALILSSKKKGTGIVEFKSTTSAQLAVENEMGLVQNPLTLTWLSGKPVESVSEKSKMSSAAYTESSTTYRPMTLQEKDFESLVLMKLRQAEERKRLLEQLKEEDESVT